MLNIASIPATAASKGRLPSIREQNISIVIPGLIDSDYNFSNWSNFDSDTTGVPDDEPAERSWSISFILETA
eukprot:gene12000-35355_t